MDVFVGVDSVDSVGDFASGEAGPVLATVLVAPLAIVRSFRIEEVGGTAAAAGADAAAGAEAEVD